MYLFNNFLFDILEHFWWIIVIGAIIFVIVRYRKKSAVNKDNQFLQQFNQLYNAVAELSRKISRQEERLNRIEQKESAVPPPAAAPVVSYKQETEAPVFPQFVSKESAAPVQEIFAGKSKPKKSIESEIGLKWLGRVGVLALIFGVSFFLKYAFENDWIGETGRVALGIVGGLALAVLGEFLRKKYIIFAQILVGGGIAILYLSIYGAFGFYHLIGQAPAFIAMAVITFCAGVLAVHYETVGLAGIGIFGGFLTPFLLSTGVNNQIGLFSYITVLNFGILGISFFRNWRGLNLLGLLGAAAVFFGWYVKFYSKDQLLLSEFFLTIFFLIFVAAAIVHNILSKKRADNIDAALVAVNGLAYFGVSYYLLNPNYHSFMGFFAAAMALFYFILAVISYKFNPEDKYLALFLPGLSVLFLTIAAPIQFKGNWITISWVMESLILVWLGFKLSNNAMRIFALIVFILAGFRLIGIDSRRAGNLEDYIVIFNKRFFTFFIGIISAFGIYYLYSFYESFIKPEERRVKIIILLAVNFLLLWILSAEVIAYYDKQIQVAQQSLISVENSFQPSLYNLKQLPDISPSKFEQERAQKQQEAWQKFYEQRKIFENRRNVALSILWAVYAIVLLGIGIFVKNKILRLVGIGLFALTVLKLFFYDLWNLGTLYRIISSVTLGAILLLASFAYNKYKEKIKEIIAE